MSYPSNVDVFEHGIEVASGNPPAGLIRLATTREPIYSGFTLTVVDLDGSPLNHRANHLLVVPAHRVSDYYEETDLRYCLGSTLYHLNRTIDIYVEKTRLFEEHHTKAPSGGTSDPRIFYEVDAFLGAARRVYQAISFILWKHYAAPRGMQGRWRSILKARDSDVIPEQFREGLRKSWDLHGEKLTEYRDCIMHYIPLTEANATCWLTRFSDRWGAEVPLPSNPEERSRAAFDFRGGVDALSYCHGVAAHIISLSERLVALPEIASYIANPPHRHLT